MSAHPYLLALYAPNRRLRKPRGATATALRARIAYARRCKRAEQARTCMVNRTHAKLALTDLKRADW